MGLATWVKLLQPAPSQRSTRYPTTPTLSVAAVHDISIWLLLTAVAVRSDGAVGGVVSGGGVFAFVVALAGFE